MRTLLRPFLLLAVLPGIAFASEPIPRRLPPPGKPIPAEAEAKLTDGVHDLRKLAAELAGHPLLPDAEIYLKAVDLALEFGEFYKPKDDVAKAHRALEEAKARLEALGENRSPWTAQRGLVVRGYRSQIDGSAQPYGLEIPEMLDLDGEPVPLYVWLHGRGDTQTDLHFLDERARKHWQFKGLLDDGIVLHPFGRQCVGYKSAGEIDVLDAVAHVLANHNADPRRVALMGFSMGGAGAWHLGAHYPDRWAVVHAGAGFVDVSRYQKLRPEQMPPAVEQALWGHYDVPAYARNLLRLPLVAYSGENDKQKDAADFMAEALLEHGLDLKHIVGPGMGHKYHPESLVEVANVVKEALAKRKPPLPPAVHLQTRTLRYHKNSWIEMLALDKHWADSRVDAALASPNHLRVSTHNVSSLRVNRSLPDGFRIHIDSTSLTVPAPVPRLVLRRDGKAWSIAERATENKLRKSPQLQGPIDDAFLAPFLVVSPTGNSADAGLDEWVHFELERFKTRWRALFRGSLRVKPDAAVTAEDAAQYNLVLFGTPESNKLVSDALAQMPLAWPAEPARVLLAIYPNPAAPGRYLVLNSGPTFREAHDRTNSLQNPKLGDWAVIGLDEPPGPERPGRIIKAGFFDESWQMIP